jgi:2-polyprenyl-3-methyl-5-hydroxy-6-metoxy-1,4-benzoquinol methylase
MPYTRKHQFSCRSCYGVLHPMLSLGSTPLANTLLKPEQLGEKEPVFPLDLAFCEDCSLVQITETVPPELLFREYLYFSSFSDTMLRHAAEIAARMMQTQGLDENSLVLEIASNDGYLLKNYRQASIPVLGIEPAENVSKVAREHNCIPTISEFFGKDLARQLASKGQMADVIHANNVLAHVPDLNGVMEGIAIVLKRSGVAVIETPYVKNLIDHCEFDTIYHEHIFYYSLTALDKLVRRHGLFIQDVELQTIHGGTLRIFVGKTEQDLEGRVAAMLSEESRWVFDQESYAGYSSAVQKRQSDLRELLCSLKAKGKRIAAYGAAAKGSTMLNCCGIGTGVLDFVVDRSTYKQGLFMPGVRLPIFAPEKLLEAQPDYVLLLTWNFADEIMRQQKEYRSRGGQFITTYPYPRVLLDATVQHEVEQTNRRVMRSGAG